MGKNRVAFYSTSWLGGSGWFVYALAAAIAEAGTPITLIAPLSDPPERDLPESNMLRRVFLLRGAAGRGGIFYRVARTAWRILDSFIKIGRARFGHSTYLVTHLDWIYIAFLQLLFIRMLGARIVNIVHDAKPHGWVFPERLRWLEFALLKGSYHLPSHLVTLTRAAKQQIVEEFGIDERKITVIPHGAFETPSLPELSGDSVLLLFGVLRRNKRVLETIQAMSLLPHDCPAQLVIAGAVHEEGSGYWDECVAEIEQNRERIRTEIGFVPEGRVESLLSECDAVLLPYEQFNSQSGVAILASLAGRSLIATDVGGIGELIADGVSVTAIARPVTPESIAAAVIAYCSRDAVERRMEAAGVKALLENKLSWKTIGQSYSTLLQTLQ